MQRRSKEVRGYVDFPVDDLEYENSNEGGMLVRLVVVPDKNHSWMACCGGLNPIVYDEELLGDDVRPDRPSLDEVIQNPVLMTQDFTTPAEKFHFPELQEAPSKGYPLESLLSTGYLCVLTLGSTGWSGWHRERQRHFRCRYENLTAEGQKLYDQIKRLYGGRGTLYLQTWLDT